MDRFGDDVMGLILRRITDPNDRKSFSQVCKQWFRVEGLSRRNLHVLETDFLFRFLPRFPNLRVFKTSKVITNANIGLVAKTCPKLKELHLNYKEADDMSNEFDDIPGLDDVNDYGICAFATGDSRLTNVYLRKRWQIGNLGVISLVRSAHNLTNLNLGRCNRITDEALETIGSAKSLRILNLQGCWLITDGGLESLASGPLSRTLEELVIAECDRITDAGVLHLQKVSRLERLDLSDCGPRVTHLSIAEIQTLRVLKLSWLINITDSMLISLPHRCPWLETLDATGCERITGHGIRALADHGALGKLFLVRCHNFTMEDLELAVLGCETLRYIKLDKSFQKWLSEEVQENLSNVACCLEWA